jgi:hypothetical protein
MSGVVVFVGPTLRLAEAKRELPDAQFLGPARRGDIARAIFERRPAAIVLIDGLFNTVPAVVHKEILFGLTQGVRMVGAASMGALRAAELWTLGMEGIGEIFRRFQTGIWDSDDEVAVTHGPPESGYRVGSVALANIRLGLEQACQHQVLTPNDAAKIVERLRTVFYPERSWQAVFQIAHRIGLRENQVNDLKAFVEARDPDGKRDDALHALRSVRACGEATTAKAHSPADPFDFEPTIFWRKILGEIHGAAPSAPDETNDNLNYTALTNDVRLQKDAREIHRGATLLHLLMAHEQENVPSAAPEQLQLAVDRFRRRRGLVTAAQAELFYQEQHLTEREIEVLARTELTLDELLAQRAGKIAGLLGLELKRRGQFAETLERVAAKRRHLEARAVSSLALEDLALTLNDLLDWYQSRYETIEGPLDSHARALGYPSAREFLSELMLEYFTQNQMNHDPQRRRA